MLPQSRQVCENYQYHFSPSSQSKEFTDLLHHFLILFPEHVLSSTDRPITAKGDVQCSSRHFKQIERTLSESTITVNKKFCLPFVKFLAIWNTRYFCTIFYSSHYRMLYCAHQCQSFHQHSSLASFWFSRVEMIDLNINKILAC